jgi:hypothetical protein
MNPIPKPNSTIRASCGDRTHIACIILCRVIAWAVIGLLGGCAVVGPPSLRNGRAVYNEAINDTNNQQMLQVVIRERYAENASLLAVNSVTANVSISTSAGFQLGFGNESNYSGNLVPFSAGAIYEENPTVSYTPVEGQKYLRQVTSPVLLSVLLPLCESAVEPGLVFSAIVNRVNDISNPGFIAPSVKPDPRFARFVELVTILGQAQALNWVQNPRPEAGFSAVMHHFKPDHDADVRELLRLLGISEQRAEGEEIVLPVSLAPGRTSKTGIVFTTRSLYKLLEILSASVDIPGEDEQSGAAVAYPPSGPLGRHLHIHRSPTKPEHAYVAVQYRGWWFYIDNTDRPTKRFFHLLTVLWSVSIAESASEAQKAPLLMLPASR